MRIEKYFHDAIKSDLLRFDIDQKTHWMTVEFKNIFSAIPSENPESIKWHTLCAQSLEDYRDKDGFIDDMKLVNRITLIMADKIRSLSQDVNILVSK